MTMSNPRVLQRLEKITVELSVLAKHVTQYGALGIDKYKAKRILVETKYIIEAAKVLQDYAEQESKG